jgi:hypothetical protein
MASESRRYTNINGSALEPLKNVKYIDTSEKLMANAVKSTPTKYKNTVENILLVIK